jgi:hypothetical protein
LEEGRHVTACKNGKPEAFLPSAILTGFPTVRRTVCSTNEARKFLESLDLTEPDPVDDVIRNVLPKYGLEKVDTRSYEADIQRILKAFSTDSKAQREKLIAELRKVSFVMVVDAGDRKKWRKKWRQLPGLTYMATERLQGLFAGVGGVHFVDESYSCLRGERPRDLLEACGTAINLQRIPAPSRFTSEELRELRRSAGCENSAGGDTIEDYSLRGLAEFLAILPNFDAPTRRNKATLLWEALSDLESRRGTSAFSGTYKWRYHKWWSTTFDAAFVRQLNQSAWVPTADGNFAPPGLVLFDTLGWKPNRFLLTVIRFKPPILETLAKAAGIEPGVLVLLKMYGLTSEADLRTRLGEIQPKPAPLLPTPSGSHADGGANGPGTTSAPKGAGAAGGLGPTISPSKRTGGDGAERTSGSAGRGTFISYVGVHSDEQEQDPDGLAHEARMALEQVAIQRIRDNEPQLQCTPPGNEGYDLFDSGEDGQPIRWIEVKAMRGGLNSRPVGLSRAQFDCARKYGTAYWLYVVEYADDAEKARMVRIQDPAGKARTFTFDKGWLGVAEVDSAPTESRINNDILCG